MIELKTHPLNISTCIELILQLLHTLNEIHQYGYVHGDVHPDNVFIDANGTVLLSDFAHALSLDNSAYSYRKENSQKGTSQKERSQSLPLGASSFASPEHQSGVIEISPCDDLYSVTMMLCGMLIGSVQPTDIRSWCINELQYYPSELRSIIERGINAQPAERFQSAQAYRLAIQALNIEDINMQANGALGAQSKHFDNNEPYQHIRTEIFSPEPKLNAQTRVLQQEITQVLRSKPYVSDEQKYQWEKALLAHGDIESPSALIETLIADAKHSLVQQGFGPWLDPRNKVTATLPFKPLIITIMLLSVSITIAFAWFVTNEPTHTVDTLDTLPLPVPASSSASVPASQADSTLAESSPQTSTSQMIPALDSSMQSVSLFDTKTQQSYNIELKQVLGHNETMLVMTQEVTQELWQVCVNAGRCRSAGVLSTDQMRKRLNLAKHPVINVSWYDITEDFIPFINEITKQNFALPTMAQWMQIAFSSEGEALIPSNMHCLDCRHSLQSEFYRVSIPSDSLGQGANGLHHVYGNVQEWLQDCWQDVKLHIQRCDQAPAVGGSYLDTRALIQTRPLNSLLKTARSTTTGFRLISREIANH
jgi:serine/threonine protein kinase